MVELDKKNIEQKLFSSEFNFGDSSMFKELMSLYPWCSSFTIAYLKSLCALDDLRFTSELEEYAAQLNSREVLYDLIHGLAEKEEFSDTLSSSVSETESSVTEKSNVVDEEVVESETEETKISDSSDDKELEKLITSKIISDNYVNELISDQEEDSTSSPQENEPETVEIQSERINKDRLDDSPRSFGEWLKLGNDSKDVESEKEFLTFEKPKKEFFSSSTKAKESIGLENLPVSETLAKVFESQGNYSMAISTYEQLILIFPEKKIFFANQIKKINTKIK